MPGVPVHGKSRTELAVTKERWGESSNKPEFAGFVDRAVNEVEIGCSERMAMKALAERYAQLRRLERLISLVDRVLRVSRPPKDGKIGVRWWRLGGRSNRMPVLVRCKQQINGRWRGEAILALNAAVFTDSGTSKINFAETVALARLARALIAEHKKLAGDLGLGQAVRLRAVQVQAARHGGWLADLVGLHHRVVKNLDRNGYAVDRATREMMDPV